MTIVFAISYKESWKQSFPRSSTSSGQSLQRESHGTSSSPGATNVFSTASRTAGLICAESKYNYEWLALLPLIFFCNISFLWLFREKEAKEKKEAATDDGVMATFRKIVSQARTPLLETMLEVVAQEQEKRQNAGEEAAA